MLKVKKISAVLLISVVALAACNTGKQKQKSDNTDQDTLKKEVSAEFQKKKEELKQLAGKEFSNINNKIRELNNKIEEGEKKLTEEHNEILDEIQERRVSANEKLNKIKDVSEEEWNEFQQKLKEDIDTIKTKLDDILDDF